MLPRRSRQVLPTVHRAADPGGDPHRAGGKGLVDRAIRKSWL